MKSTPGVSDSASSSSGVGATMLMWLYGREGVGR